MSQGPSPLAETLQQVASLCETAFGFEPTGPSGAGRTEIVDRAGVSEVQLTREEGSVGLEVVMLRTAVSSTIPARWLEAASRMQDDAVVPALRLDGQEVVLASKIEVPGRPLDFARSALLLQRLKKIDTVVERLEGQSPSPAVSSDAKTPLDASGRVAALFEPVARLSLSESSGACDRFFEELVELVRAGISVALVGAALPCRFGLAWLAGSLPPLAERSSGLLELRASCIPVQTLVELLPELPGVFAAPATALASTLNRHDLASEIEVLFGCLSERGQSVVLHGSEAQLERLLHGGQSGTADPLRPVVLEVPEAGVELLSGFALERAATAVEPTPRPDALEATRRVVVTTLASTSEEARSRLLDPIARRALTALSTSSTPAALSSQLSRFAGRLAAFERTLRDPGRPASRLGAATPRRLLTDKLATDDLKTHLRDRICGQNQAIGELVQRLAYECLAGPEDRPLRLLALGPPGVGKTETLKQMAAWLEAPYHRIDCSSFADAYAATSQLLGSARGLVGSDRPGRLQQICNKPGILEIADLDHSRDGVRESLADLWLQLLDEGRGESAQGHTFSTAGLLIAFTMNLPNGSDLRLWRSLGFGERSHEQARAEADNELHKLVSRALSSRLGRPILYRPLEAREHRQILGRLLEDSARTVCQRLGIEIRHVVIDTDAAEYVLTSAGYSDGGRGAREIARLAREAAVAALTRSKDSPLCASTQQGVLTLTPARGSGGAPIENDNPQQGDRP